MYACDTMLEHMVERILRNPSGSTLQELMEYEDVCGFYADTTVNVDQDGDITDDPDTGNLGTIHCNEHTHRDPSWWDSNEWYLALSEACLDQGVAICDHEDHHVTDRLVFHTQGQLMTHFRAEHEDDLDEDLDEIDLDFTPAEPLPNGCLTIHPVLTPAQRRELTAIMTRHPRDNGFLILTTPETGEWPAMAVDTADRQATPDQIREWQRRWPNYFYIARADRHCTAIAGHTTHDGWNA